MTREDFIKECDEWLNPKGYYIQSISGSSNNITYINSYSNKPTIHCWEDISGKHVSLTSCMHFKLFLKLESGELQFKHPDIDNWIDTMEYYENLAENIPPW